MKVAVKNNVHWVGKIDWELRKFHGDEYSTHRGSSYNSYLIQEEKTALVDTVWAPFAEEYVSNLAGEIELETIDYIIANHAEIDHSGALPRLLERIPDTPVYCTANGVKSLTGHYHRDWNFRVVKTGDRLNLGGKELIFVEAPMLHWPDSMFCYLTGDNILFSNDAFGQHYASEYLFNDLVDQNELITESLKYYANILTPFSSSVEKKIHEFLGLDLPLDIICTSHGIIWRTNPAQIVERYLQWAKAYKENQITIVYDTMWNGTRVMAERIAQGIGNEDPDVNVKLFNIAVSDKNDVVAEVFKSKGVVFGSPTINRGILTAVAALFEQIKGLSFSGKKAAVFGSYGWSGESTKVLGESLRQAGFTVVDEGLKVQWNPSEKNIEECLAYGRKLAKALS
ncbi:MAG: anaerobic nitric oxide reductase flavorubredoxin [Spirochaetaceae bacterium]|nr:MAG: anaerobic nitric oxide reductase flavorubredoxin [Spirochaetaceae bacterium]